MSPEDKEALRQANLLRPDEKARWTFLGKHFGYPNCCIHFFCNEWQDIINECLVNRVFDGGPMIKLNRFDSFWANSYCPYYKRISKTLDGKEVVDIYTHSGKVWVRREAN